MADLKPCPFCGGAEIDVCKEGQPFGKSAYSRTYVFVRCRKCYARTGIYGTKPKAIEAWNRRTKIEVNFYDKEETYTNCTVQVLTNTVTGDVSVGWWKNGGNEDG